MELGHERSRGSEWELEVQRLQRVRAVIEQQMEATEEILHGKKSQLFNFRGHFWDEISVNIDTPEDLLETQVSIIQQSLVMKTQEHSLAHARQSLRRLEKQYPSPYFARIDFKEKGEMSETTTFYFGIHTVTDEPPGELLVYDWRAPVGELFYDFELGQANYESLEEEVSGEILLKRQYRIENGQLLDMFNTGIHIVDRMLQHMLGRSADDKMKSIVTTIQKEQNAIIREDRYPLLIVQGTAGSGKTSVALQRVAYLLYKYRHTLEADQILLFSPNQMFNDYVSTVLPELGEQNMLQTTFQHYIEYRLGSDVKSEDAYDQLEALLQVKDDAEAQARLGGIRYKGSEQFMQLLNTYVTHLATRGLKFVDYVANGKVVISKEFLEQQFYDNREPLPISRRLGKFQEWINEELREKQKVWTRNYYRKLLKVPKYIGTEEELKVMSKRKMKREFARLYEMTEHMKFIDVMATYRSLFEESQLTVELFGLSGLRIPDHWDEICKHTLKQLKGKAVPYEDSVPLFYFKEKLEGVQQFHRIHHVIIDEAQDYTPFQFELIKTMFPRSRMTLLGDVNQGIFPTGQNSYEFVRKLWGDDQTKMFRMLKSYRSTAEISEWTRQLLPDGEAVEPFDRHGQAPQIIGARSGDHKAQWIAEQISEWLQQGIQSIAVICRTAEESKQAYNQLSPFHSLTLVHKDMKTYVGGLLVIPAYLAKGLEFDAVIIYDASADKYYRESERKLFYTACTRAMHHLHLYYIDDLTPFLKGICKV